MTQIMMVRRAIGAVAAGGAGTALWAGLVTAPTDAVQGEPQRLMYVHVPSAWVAYLSFAVVLLGSAGYLWQRDLRWDRAAQAAGELGVGLTALAILLGSLWGRPVWGAWWVWDPRLVTTAVLLLSYVGYLGVRGTSDDPHVAARRAAVAGVLAFVNVPLVHFSVVWWRTLHQPPTLLRPAADPPIDPGMLMALLLALVAFSAAAAWVWLRRVAQLAPAPQAAPPSSSRRPSIRISAGGS